MPYTYKQEKKAPLAIAEEDEELDWTNESDSSSGYGTKGFDQASGSGEGAGQDKLQQRLLQGYMTDKSAQLQEFREHGYNKEELKVDMALLVDFQHEFSDLSACKDWHISDASEAVQLMIDTVLQMDIKALNGEQKQIMRGIIDLSRQATDAVMLAALHLPLGQALLAAREESGAVPPTAKDISEAAANLATAQGAIKKGGTAALDCIKQISDKDKSFSGLKVEVNSVYRCLYWLGEGKVNRVQKTLSPDKSLTEQVKKIIPSTVDVLKTTGASTVNMLQQLPTAPEVWQAAAKTVLQETWQDASKLAGKTGSAINNKRKVVLPSWNSLTATVGRGIKNTMLQGLYGSWGNSLVEDAAKAEFRESQKLLVEPIYFAISAYLKSSQALAATQPDEMEQRITLRYQRQAAIERVEYLQSMLKLEANSLKEAYPGQEEKVTPFVANIDQALGYFWQSAAQLEQVLASLIMAPSNDEEEGVFAGNQQGELIGAVTAVTRSQQQLKEIVIKDTQKSFDELSVDWRIAREIGRYFFAQREAWQAAYQQTDIEEFDAVVEKVIWTQIAGDFKKAHSPRGKQMAVRATQSYFEAVAGTLQRGKSIQEIVKERDSVGNYLAKTGTKSLTGRAVFAGVSGDMSRLIRINQRNILIPSLGVVKVLFSPLSFWSDYRKLSRAVEPGEAFSWQSYRKMAMRNAFKQAFRLLKFVLPNVAKFGLSVALTAWALYQKGGVDTVQKALTEGLIDVPLAGGLVGANNLLRAGLGIQPQTSGGIEGSEGSLDISGDEAIIHGTDIEDNEEITDTPNNSSTRRVHSLFSAGNDREDSDLDEDGTYPLSEQQLTPADSSIQREGKKVRVRRFRLNKGQMEKELAQLRRIAKARQEAEAAASNQKKATGNQHGKGLQENISSPRSDEDIKKEIQKISNTLKQLNQPILNPLQRIQERIAAMINQYNEGKPEESWLTPDTPVRVTVISKKRIKASAQGVIVKSAQNISPDHRATFALKDVMSGKYKYELDRLTGHKLSDYEIVIQEDKKIIERVKAFINSVDRNALQSSLQDETDQYFDNPDNAKGFSKVTEGIVKMRVLAYLDEHGDGNEFSQHLSDFYAGKIPAHDLYIDGIRVPGVFSFKKGEGIGSKTLVLNIYTDESFIFETKSISGRVPGVAGMTRRKDFPVDDMVPPSAWDGFNNMVQQALPLYEQRKYTDEKNPFRYKSYIFDAPRSFIEFKSGSRRDNMPALIINDIKNKIKQDYDTHIYSNTEQMFDYGMLLASKIITSLSLGAGVASGPLGILFALGIDATYVAAKFTQAQMSDNPTESDEMKSEAIWESVFLGTGAVGETINVALKSYRELKPQLRKILKTMNESSNTKHNALLPGKVEVPSTIVLKEKPAGSLPAVTGTLPNSRSPVIDIINEVTERSIPTSKGQRYIYQLGETGGERWGLFEKYVKSSRSRHDIPAENVFGELTANRKSTIFNTPQPDSLSKLTKNDRLDIPVHGSSFGPVDAGSKHLDIPMQSYPAKDVAKKLYDRGLRDVGVLRIDACNLGDGRYLDDLKRELEKLGIKFGYLCAPNGYLQVTHFPGTNMRPVWTWRLTEPWRVVKGNADVNFPGTKYNKEKIP